MVFQVLLAGALTAGYVVRTQWSNLVSALRSASRRERSCK